MSPSRCYACKWPPFTTYPPIRRFKQLLLGASLDGQLCILPPPISLPRTDCITQRDSAITFHTPFITQLSDELLYEIFTYALSGELWQPSLPQRHSFPQRALTLSKVSKRFYRIVHPLIYSTIYLSDHNIAPPCRTIKLLHRTMKENQALGSMVRRLSVNVEFLTTASEDKFTIGRELLDSAQNVESFSLYGADRPSSWPMIKSTVKNWPRIKHITLSLSRYNWDLLTTPVCELILATPTLRTMNLHGGYAPSSPYTTSRLMLTPTTKDIERTSNITELNITNFGGRPQALQTLLKLPRALEYFTFGKIYSTPFQWRLEMFQRLLADHQNTLKSIEIGSLPSVGFTFTPINFMDYPKLEKLNLSYWVYRETAETAAASILALKLHTFIWDFQIIDQHTESCSDFDEPQKEWLLKVAELAAARNSALKKIKIIFEPDTYDYITTREQLATYVTPWDRMADVKAKIKPLGIELEYNEVWTREKCLQEIERADKFEEEGGLTDASIEQAEKLQEEDLTDTSSTY